MSSLLSPQVDEFITKFIKWTNWNCLSPQVDEFIIKSTSGPVYHKVHKVDELKFFKSTSGQVHYKVDKFITKWTNWNCLSPQSGRVHLMGMPWNYQVHKWTNLSSGRGYYYWVHKWMDLLLGPQIKPIHYHA